MTGFDKWTASVMPEQVARLIAVSPCSAMPYICPLYNECVMMRKRAATPGYIAEFCECYNKLCEYFDKEIES